MEVRYNVVCVMESYVYSSIRLYNSGKSTNCKLYLESLCKKHRCSKPEGASINSCLPTENFNSSRYSNNHCCTCKVSTSIYIEPHCVHVMRPDEETLYCNCTHSINHPYITKYWFTCKEAQYMRYNSKSGQNLNIHLRVPEKPIYYLRLVIDIDYTLSKSPKYIGLCPQVD